MIIFRLWFILNYHLPYFMLFLRHDLLLFNQHATSALCYGIKTWTSPNVTLLCLLRRKYQKVAHPKWIIRKNLRKHGTTYIKLEKCHWNYNPLRDHRRRSCKISLKALWNMYSIHYVTNREQHLYKLKKLTLVKLLFFSFNYR